MPENHAAARDRVSATMEAHAQIVEPVRVQDILTVECYSAAGELLWREDTPSLVTKAPEPHR